MNRKVQFFITVCLWSFSLLSSSDRPLTLKESIAVGGVVAVAEVAVPGQLLSNAMNCAIKKEPFVLSRSYHGFFTNAGGQMPITAVQKAVQAKGSQFVESMQQNQPLTDWQKVGISSFAGMSGAVIDTPSNAVQLYQQKLGNEHKSFVQACKELGLKGLGRGYTANAFLKEAPFTVGYQVLGPLGKKIVGQYVDNDFASTALGGSCAGVVTAIATQPGAVIRNKMQGDLAKTVYKSTVQTAQKIYREEGAAGLFRGLPARGTRVACAIPLYVGYSQVLEKEIKSL